MTFHSENLQEALGLARGNQSKNPKDPRAHILLRPHGNGVSVVCADDTTETEVVCAGGINAPMAVAPQLADLVRTMQSGQSVKLLATDKGACRVQAGSSRFTLPMMDASAFPLFEGDKEPATHVKVKAKALLQALDSVANGLSKPVSGKPWTAGVLVQCTDKGIVLVTSNGFTLVALGIAARLQSAGVAREGVVPEMGLRQIQRLAHSASAEEEIELHLGPRQLSAGLRGATVKSRLIEGRYPDFRKVMQIDLACSVGVSRSHLLAVLKRVGLFVQESSPFVTIKAERAEEGANQTLRLVCIVKTPQGECTESLPASQGNESLATAAFQGAQAHLNLSYLAAVLAAMPQDSVYVDFGSGALRIRSSDAHSNAVAVAAYYRV